MVSSLTVTAGTVWAGTPPPPLTPTMDSRRRWESVGEVTSAVQHVTGRAGVGHLE